MPKSKDVTLYGKASAALYLGVSEVWLEKLVKRGLIRYWQEQPPTTREDGVGNKVVTHGSGLVFTQVMLDEYLAKPKVGKGAPKLNAEQVAAIREAVQNGATQRALAAQYGVDPSTISLIVTNRRRA